MKAFACTRRVPLHLIIIAESWEILINKFLPKDFTSDLYANFFR